MNDNRPRDLFGNSELLDLVIRETSESTPASCIDLPINQARVTFVLTRNVVGSPHEFHEWLVTFTAHALQYTGGLAPPVDRDALGTEALKLLEGAFNGSGGYQTALAEALKPTERGGLRYVLDRMTDQVCKAQHVKQVNFVLTRTLRDQDPVQHAAFVVALLKSRCRARLQAPYERMSNGRHDLGLLRFATV